MYKTILTSILFILCAHINLFAAPKPNKQFTIVIEAGQNGLYKGSGFIENALSDKLTNDYILELKKLAEEKNFNIVLAGEKDRLFDPNKRKEFLTLNKANLFLSLHFNNSEDINKRGFECYVPTDNNTYENRVLGKFIGAELYNVQNMKFNGVNIQKKAQLNGLTVATAIIELGYISNSNDMQVISNDLSKKEICEKLVNAISSFKAHLEMEK